MNNNYYFGVFLGVFLLLIIIRRKFKFTECKYDERQTAIRGKAYKYAMITGVIAGIIAAILVETDMFPVTGSLAIIMVSLLMITVYTVYMVISGVYFGISGNWKRWTVLISAIGLFNLIIGIGRIADEGLPEKHLTVINVNLPLGIMFLIIAVSVLFQKLREHRGNEL